MKKYQLLVALCLISGCVKSHDRCDPPNGVVARYLAEHPDWSLVSFADLNKDDQLLWEQYHEGRCPGIAAVDIVGDGQNFYALALKKMVDKHWEEKLVLLGQGSNQPSFLELAKPSVVISPFVVWVVDPGSYYDQSSQKQVVIQGQSVIYEKMESISTQYYMKNGKIHSLLVAD